MRMLVKDRDRSGRGHGVVSSPVGRRRSRITKNPLRLCRCGFEKLLEPLVRACSGSRHPSPATGTTTTDARVHDVLPRPPEYTQETRPRVGINVAPITSMIRRRRTLRVFDVGRTFAGSNFVIRMTRAFSATRD